MHYRLQIKPAQKNVTALLCKLGCPISETIGNTVQITNCVSHLCPLGVSTAIEDGVGTKVKPWTTANQPRRQKAVQPPSQSFQQQSTVLICNSQQQHLSRDMLFNQRMARLFGECCAWECWCGQVTGELKAMVSRVQAQ